MLDWIDRRTRIIRSIAAGGVLLTVAVLVLSVTTRAPADDSTSLNANSRRVDLDGRSTAERHRGELSSEAVVEARRPVAVLNVTAVTPSPVVESTSGSSSTTTTTAEPPSTAEASSTGATTNSTTAAQTTETTITTNPDETTAPRGDEDDD